MRKASYRMALSCGLLSRPKRCFQGLSLALVILALDQLSKWIVFHQIPYAASSIYPYGGIGIFKDFLGIEFSINYMMNTGAAWGLFGHYQLPLLLFRLGLISGLIAYLLFYNKQPAWEIPFVLVLSGAISNVMDYFIYGHVIDMFHFNFWGFDFAVFNIADCMITL
ncbi:MAG: signal peptidase II, partial [Parachlamydia sp.]|nr:signal peptidase II [Parachlamydia sp.]